MLNSKRVSFAAMLVSLAGLAGTVSAETAWQKNHPRRTQVNQRLNNQNKNGQENNISGQIPPK
jgi:hypothetical protein